MTTLTPVEELFSPLELPFMIAMTDYTAKTDENVIRKNNNVIQFENPSTKQITVSMVHLLLRDIEI